MLKLQTEKHMKCSCGNKLKAMKATVIYNGNIVECDICHRNSQQDDIFWHCLGEKNNTHSFGWDICGICIEYYHHIESVYKTADIDCADNDILSCQQWKQLKRVMETFNNDNHDKCLIEMNLSEVINDYLHLFQNHNESDQFECIMKQLKHCNISTCQSFRRHYRDRNNNFNQKYTDIRTQIFDKIHCYYYHITAVRHELISVTTEQKYNNLDSDMTDIKQQIAQRATKKYNQLFHTPQNQNLYKAGYKFIYGYLGENIDDSGKIVKVASKYSSFKQELISNSVSTISVKQFSNEYQKAIIYLNSTYCKKTFVTLAFEEEPWYFLIQHLLSLMIYCNFTELQYEFSKTYRQNQGSSHDNFYFLGMYLKIAVQIFGTQIRNGHVKIFYHGMGEKLLFPKYVTDCFTGVSNLGVSIYGPLSTTSSLQVATMFTNNNNGIIVEFGGIYFENSLSKYFPVSWLSDYSSEQEYLFVQNEEHFAINNIYDPQLGYEYGDILMALETLQHIISNLYGNLYTKKILPHIPSKTVKLIQNILNHQLASISWYKSLDKYAKQIITMFLKNHMAIDLNIESFKKMNNLSDSVTIVPVLKLLYDFKNEWINMHGIEIMFPNVIWLTIIDIRIGSATMDNIFNHLKANSVSKLEKITVIQTNASNVLSLMSNYQKQFQKINYCIKIFNDATDITICKMHELKD